MPCCEWAITKSGHICPSGPFGIPWPTTGDLDICKAEHSCGYCSFHFDTNGQLRDHVYNTHVDVEKGSKEWRDIKLLNYRPKSKRVSDMNKMVGEGGIPGEIDDNVATHAQTEEDEARPSTPPPPPEFSSLAAPPSLSHSSKSKNAVPETFPGSQRMSSEDGDKTMGEYSIINGKEVPICDPFSAILNNRSNEKRFRIPSRKRTRPEQEDDSQFDVSRINGGQTSGCDLPTSSANGRVNKGDEVIRAALEHLQKRKRSEIHSSMIDRDPSSIAKDKETFMPTSSPSSPGGRINQETALTAARPSSLKRTQSEVNDSDIDEEDSEIINGSQIPLRDRFIAASHDRTAQSSPLRPSTLKKQNGALRHYSDTTATGRIDKRVRFYAPEKARRGRHVTEQGETMGDLESRLRVIRNKIKILELRNEEERCLSKLDFLRRMEEGSEEYIVLN